MYLFFLVILLDLILKFKKPTVLRIWCSIQIWPFRLNWMSLELRKREFSYFDFTHTHSSGHKQRNNQQRQLSIMLWKVKACVDSTVVTVSPWTNEQDGIVIYQAPVLCTPGWSCARFELRLAVSFIWARWNNSTVKITVLIDCLLGYCDLIYYCW